MFQPLALIHWLDALALFTQSTFAFMELESLVLSFVLNQG